MTYAETSAHHHYVTVRHAGRYGLLAGPYRTRQEAEAMVEPVRQLAATVNDRAHWYSYGTARVTTQSPRPGKLNHLLNS